MTEFIVLGKFPIDELNELLNSNIVSENDDFETLGGLVLNQAGISRKRATHFHLENHKFTVKEIANKRIKKVLIEKLILNKDMHEKGLFYKRNDYSSQLLSHQLHILFRINLMILFLNRVKK